ncbi:hypothetical protein [Tautonia marina]|uniref:hypothetical protein n=1 Tax=Tautonia marina TaxID=2653855 RepID=UPI0012609A99|nr:hypothetical protein [Tautonia marina]
MKHSTLALLIGGLLPAVLFGVSGVMQKACARTGIGTGPYLVITGLAVLTIGGFLTLVDQEIAISRRSAAYTAVFGVFWAAGVGCIAIALQRFGGQISQLVPLYNMNTLIAVFIGLIVLAEWREVHWGRLLLASLLIISGGLLAATSSKAVLGP